MEEEPGGEEEEECGVAAQGRAVMVDAGLDGTEGEGAIGGGAVDDIILRVELVGHCCYGHSQWVAKLRAEFDTRVVVSGSRRARGSNKEDAHDENLMSIRKA